MTLMEVCPESEFEMETIRRVITDAGEAIAVYRVSAGFFATQDICSHGAASLADGFLEGDEIECPLHAGRFCVRDGRAIEEPATEKLRTFAVFIRQGSVVVET